MTTRILSALLLGGLLALTVAGARGADIQISQLADLTFGTASPTSGTLTRSLRFCVTQDLPGRYGVIATGEGGDGRFALRNGIAELPFSVFYSDKINRPGTQLVAGLELGNLRGAKRHWRNGCRRANSRIDVVVDAAALEATMSGQFSGTLVLMVTPQ